MNTEEGLSRIAKALNWLGTGVAVISLVVGIIAVFGSSSDKGEIFGVAAVFSLLCYGFGRLLRWLIEGFTGISDHKENTHQAIVFDKARGLMSSKDGQKKLAAFALFVLAVAIPILAEELAPDSRIDSARMVGYMIGAGLPIVLIAWAVTKAPSRSNLLLAFGAIAVIWASASSIKEWSAQKELKQSVQNVADLLNTAATSNSGGQVKQLPPAVDSGKVAIDIKVPGQYDSGAADAAAFMKDFSRLLRAHNEKMSVLGKKFESPDAALDAVLLPENFTNPTRLAESRVRLNRYKQLVLERQKLVSDYLQQSEELIKGADVSEHFRQSALDGFKKSLPQTVNNYKRLDQSQLGVVKTASEILDIAERGMGKIQVEGNSVLFVTQTDLDNYNAKMTRIHRLAKEEEVATKAIMNAFESSRRNINSLAESQ